MADPIVPKSIRFAKTAALGLVIALVVSFMGFTKAEESLNLTVNVTDDCGPVIAQIIIVNGPDDGAFGVTDSSGRFTFQGLNPGVFYLHITADNHESMDTDEIVLTSDQTVSYALQRNNGCPVTFVDFTFNVRDACNSQPVVNAAVAINRDFGNGASRTTDGNGFAHFGVQANTDIGWTVSKSGYNNASGNANSGGGRNNEVTLTRTCPPTQARVTLLKEVRNDNGGTARPEDFELRIGGQTIRSGQTVNLNPGNYQATENQRTGYQLLGWRGACDGNGNVSVSAGQNVTCVATNDDVAPAPAGSARVTLVKEVRNDNGGTAQPGDFELKIGGQTLRSGQSVTLAPGNYRATETQRTGYTLVNWRGACDGDGSVTLRANDSVTCTATNDDNSTTTTTLAPSSECANGIIRVGTNNDLASYSIAGPGGSFSNRGSRIFFNQRAGNYSIQIEDLPNFTETANPASVTLPCNGDVSFIITYISTVQSVSVAPISVSQAPALSVSPACISGMIRIQTNRDEPLYTVTGPGGSFSSRGSRIFFNQRAGNYSIQIEDLPNFIETVTPTSGTLPCDGSLSFIITYTSIVAATTPTIQPVAIVAGGNVDLVLSKRVSTTAARPGDAVVYTLTVENRGNANSNSFVVEDELADVLQLAELLDFGGAQFDLARHKLTWPAVVVPAFGRVEKTFSVRVRNSFPAGSDSVMTNVYGNRVDVNVVRPQVAGAFVAPKTGAKTTISFGLSILTLSGYIIAHRRKGKERTIENPL